MTHPPDPQPFRRAIEHLLRTNNFVVYGRIVEIPDAEVQPVLDLLRQRYAHEALGYPGTPPAWDPAAAEWSVRILFHAGQLLLYRTHGADTLTELFPAFERPQTAGAALSADLCLRYLPSILKQLEAIDADDALVPVLRAVLHNWPYTGLLLGDEIKDVDLSPIFQEECLIRLFIDRVIETKNEALAAHPELRRRVLTVLGNHADAYWNDLNIPQ